ncbi:lysophospholipid acyltransferase family protein [Maricaulaceae bacterium EIL42A08]|nr:lysophospholipid acyltransferase family protein [Maricaulaceae bacterium EIL42A08]
MAKSFLKSAPVQAIIGTLLGAYMGFVGATTRWERRGVEHITPIREGRDGLIGTIWHSRIMLSPSIWPKGAQPPKVLISRSGEGDAIARAAAVNGVGAIRGSSMNLRKREKSKGAMSGFKQMVRHLRDGGCMAIMPDGPRGPRMRLGLGPLMIAQMAGVPIVPATWSTRWGKTFNSWDRFILPFPFGKGIIAYGEPITVPRDATPETLEALRTELEARMIALTHLADEACGRIKTEPAEPR